MRSCLKWTKFGVFHIVTYKRNARVQNSTGLERLSYRDIIPPGGVCGTWWEEGGVVDSIPIK